MTVSSPSRLTGVKTFWSGLQNRERFLLQIAVAACVLALLWWLIVPPWKELRGAEETLQVLQQQLATMEQQAAMVKALRTQDAQGGAVPMCPLPSEAGGTLWKVENVDPGKLQSCLQNLDIRRADLLHRQGRWSGSWSLNP